MCRERREKKGKKGVNDIKKSKRNGAEVKTLCNYVLGEGYGHHLGFIGARAWRMKIENRK